MIKIALMSIAVSNQIAHNQPQVLLLVLAQAIQRVLELAGQLAEELRLARLPIEVGRIEAGRLEEEDEIDPLIILVIDSLLPLARVFVYARVRDLQV